MEGILQPNTSQRRKIHPHKFALWLGMGSIAMMFAGFTSAYMVRQAQGSWRLFKMPPVFYISTLVILLSSVTLYMGVRAFKARRMLQYRSLITGTLTLGLTFGLLQCIGFYQLYHQPQKTVIAGTGAVITDTVRVNGNPSESFLFIITGMHLAHILGGIVALLIVFLKAYHKRVKTYNATGLEIISSYWHFVDVLWIYLFIFFLANQ
jgi:cytochrome c oxidase subunit 3